MYIDSVNEHRSNWHQSVYVHSECVTFLSACKLNVTFCVSPTVHPFHPSQVVFPLTEKNCFPTELQALYKQWLVFDPPLATGGVSPSCSMPGLYPGEVLYRIEWARPPYTCKYVYRCTCIWRWELCWLIFNVIFKEVQWNWMRVFYIFYWWAQIILNLS